MGNDSLQSKSNPENNVNDGGYGSEGQGNPGLQAGLEISHFPFKESDNNNSILNDYSVENESLHENSGRTRDITGLNLNNNEFNISRDDVFDEESKHNFLSIKRFGEKIDLELFCQFEGKQGTESYIDNKDVGKIIENNEIKTKDKELDRIEIEESSKNKNENNIENKKWKEDGKKTIFKISKEEEKKSNICGRKKKKDKDQGLSGKHTKNSEDNKIRKIKSNFWKNLYLFINSSFIQKNEFLKLEKKVTERLKKDFNEKLFKMRIKDIYFNYKISDKYVIYDKDSNKKLINKIYKEQKETAVIKILNLTYLEAFDIFRRNIKEEKDISRELKSKIKGTNFLDNKRFKDFDCFIMEKIRRGEENNKSKNGKIEVYINDLTRLCLHFEEWFGDKIARNKSNNGKKEKPIKSQKK